MRTNVLWVQRCGQLSYRCVELRSVEQGLWEMTSAMRKHHVAACHPPWPTRPQFAGSPAPRSGVALQKAFSQRHPSLLIPSPTARSDGRTNAIISMGSNLSGVIAASRGVLVLLNYSCWAVGGEAAGEPRALGAALGAAMGAAGAWEDTPRVRVGVRPSRLWPWTRVGSAWCPVSSAVLPDPLVTRTCHSTFWHLAPR